VPELVLVELAFAFFVFVLQYKKTLAMLLALDPIACVGIAITVVVGAFPMSLLVEETATVAFPIGIPDLDIPLDQRPFLIESQ